MRLSALRERKDCINGDRTLCIDCDRRCLNLRLSILFGSKLYEVITVFKKIMVATDGSETSVRTAKLAIGLARLSGGRVAAIYVVDIYRLAQLPGYTTLPGLSERLMELMLKEGEEATSEIGEMASDA
ncbi:MAG: hypothetical protein EHM65_03165, partial [Acidobacteriales bacterium]